MARGRPGEPNLETSETNSQVQIPPNILQEIEKALMTKVAAGNAELSVGLQGELDQATLELKSMMLEAIKTLSDKSSSGKDPPPDHNFILVNNEEAFEGTKDSTGQSN